MVDDFWDDDVASLDLTDLEKNGLQVFRNYKRAFDSYSEKKFSELIDAESFDTAPLRQVHALIVGEDVRFLPVIASAYMDERLKGLLKNEVPACMPGGSSALFAPYGPFASLFNKIQLALVFDLMSRDMIFDLDRIRRTRNAISHSWDTSSFCDLHMKSELKALFPVETVLAENQKEANAVFTNMDSLKTLRVRFAWMMTRLTYEAAYYSRAKRMRLRPFAALYGPNRPKRLSVLSSLTKEASNRIIGG